MRSDEWFRNSEWNDEAAEFFEVKLKRARRKAQYLRIQACCLAKNEPEVALKLLDRYFSLDDRFDDAPAYCDKAVAFKSLGRLADAVESYEKALRREAELPNHLTQAYLDLPYLVATTPIPQMFDRAQSLLEDFRSRLMFPVDFFRWNLAYAFILYAQEQIREASAYAQAALEAASLKSSGLRYHKELGLVGSEFSEVVQRLRRIAHAA